MHLNPRGLRNDWHILINFIPDMEEMYILLLLGKKACKKHASWSSTRLKKEIIEYSFDRLPLIRKYSALISKELEKKPSDQISTEFGLPIKVVKLLKNDYETPSVELVSEAKLKTQLKRWKEESMFMQIDEPHEKIKMKERKNCVYCLQNKKKSSCNFRCSGCSAWLHENCFEGFHNS
jgi:hypothetical protein